LEKKYVVEIEAEELMQLVDFEEKEGSCEDQRRLWRMNTWWRMMLKSLFSWWIFRRRCGSVRRRLWRRKM
jgi:hypothetical protein